MRQQQYYGAYGLQAGIARQAPNYIMPSAPVYGGHQMYTPQVPQ